VNRRKESNLMKITTTSSQVKPVLAPVDEITANDRDVALIRQSFRNWLSHWSEPDERPVVAKIIREELPAWETKA
jgi:hypothetical protein